MSLRDNAEAIAVEEDVSDQRISFIENDPVIQKLFEDAIEVLRLVGADENVEYSNQQSSGAQYLKKRRREEVQIHHKNERPANKQPEMTKSKRRKLEKIKAPVTILRKPQQEKVSTDEEQEIAVKRMLYYVGQMPSQEAFQPPPVPFVSLSTNVKEGDCIGNTQSTSESIQDSTYLSNEKDISLWKMLVASPTKCNVFVGGLSPEVSSEILHAAFKTFIVEEEEKDKLKAHVVLDFKSQHSRGYGFVTFPNRRSTELGLICMQDFEIYGRTMQLGWGQKDLEVEVLNDGNPRSYKSELQSVEQHTLIVKKKKKKKGNIVCDTVYLDAKDASLKQAKSHSSRWDQEMPKKYQRTTEDAADQDECEDGRGAKNQRVIQWVTHAQKVALVKLVCANLRSQGVSGHIGVFGIHYEADNSRLYVVCAKHVTAPQLYDEFSVFGSAQVKLNFDANGMSKGCAFIQYTNSKSAEKAIKQLHGKVVGGMPMKVMVAEPKVHGGSRKKNAAMQI